MPSLTKEIPPNSGLHKKLVGMLSSRLKLAHKAQLEKHGDWDKAEDTILAYVPESDLDAARRNKRESEGEPKYTTIKIPYTFALLMAYHTYLTSVFFARSPVHQFAGRHGETEDQVQALEALISYQTEVGEMLGPYYLWLYDAGKYGLGVVEEYWCEEELQYAQIMQDPEDENKKVLVRVRRVGYKGNKISNIHPRDFLPDPRVPVGRFQEGEFAFARKRLSWETIVRRKAQGYYMNTDRLKGKGTRDFASEVAGSSQGSSQLDRPENNINLVLDDATEEKHPAVVVAYEGCVTIIPSEWGLGDSDFPEKWMFTITGDLATIIGCQPHGAMHCRYPYGVLEQEVEAYGTWNRGLPDIIDPLQNTMDWLLNQHFFNVRAALNNQFIIDPSKIVVRDSEDGGPGFVYRLRPEAYGQDIRSFFYQVPVADVTRSHVTDVNTMLSVGERVTGINDQILGVLSGAGRKTATEVRTSTGFGVNRLKTTAEYMSNTGFSQHTSRILMNTQQYYDGTQKFRIAGNLITDMSQGAMQHFLEVTPEMIQGQYNFVPVDGTLPVDRLALANLWKELLLQMRTVPGLVAQYDLGRIFAHVANLAGIRNLQQFKLQIGSPESLQQQADQGNLVPLPGNNNARGVPTAGVGGGAPPVSAPYPAA